MVRYSQISVFVDASTHERRRVWILCRQHDWGDPATEYALDGRLGRLLDRTSTVSAVLLLFLSLWLLSMAAYLNECIILGLSFQLIYVLHMKWAHVAFNQQCKIQR
jgi:hypothetical protein